MFNFKFNRMAPSLARGVALPPGTARARGLVPGFGRLGLVGALGGLLLGLSAPVLNAGKPEIDLTYFNGGVYYMIGPKLINNPSPKLLAQSEELYLVAYPINPDGRTDLGPLTLPSGYQPGCNPCFRAGMPAQFGYHDHVVGGAPGFGNNGTAGVYEAPWKVILLMYSPDVSLSKTFTPITSAADIDAAEAAGEFQRINNNLTKGPNPYEIQTGKVLICPLVSPHA